MILCLLDGVEYVLPEPFMADSSVEAFDVSILLRFAWLEVFQPDPAS
ncbi:hypothetical protein IWQ51_004064 [Labrenzia sp. EL_142]|nr:hypothetical protein [Labrenzia sp. EL_142]